MWRPETKTNNFIKTNRIVYMVDKIQHKMTKIVI